MTSVGNLEVEWETRFPHTTRVNAEMTQDGTIWVVSCPYCGLHHEFGSDGTYASAGLRSPHCGPTARGKPDLFLIPDGFINDHMLKGYRRMDVKVRKRLAREAAAQTHPPHQ